MRGVDEETLLAVRASLAAEGLNTDAVDALISLKIRELNPWLTLEEFLKSGYRGLCWVVIDKNQVEMVRLDITFADIKLNMPIQKERITRAQPIHKPELPQDEHNDKMPLVR